MLYEYIMGKSFQKGGTFFSAATFFQLRLSGCRTITKVNNSTPGTPLELHFLSFKGRLDGCTPLCTYRSRTCTTMVFSWCSRMGFLGIIYIYITITHKYPLYRAYSSGFPMTGYVGRGTSKYPLSLGVWYFLTYLEDGLPGLGWFSG